MKKLYIIIGLTIMISGFFVENYFGLAMSMIGGTLIGYNITNKK